MSLMPSRLASQLTKAEIVFEVFSSGARAEQAGRILPARLKGHGSVATTAVFDKRIGLFDKRQEERITAANHKG